MSREYFLSLIEIMDSILSNDVPTTINMITQCIKVLTYVSHLSSQSSELKYYAL